MQAVSQEFKDALNVSHNLATTITVTPPGGDELELRWSSCRVTSGNDTGVRHSAALSVIPVEGLDLYSILSTPGAAYRIEHGIDFGAGDPELIPLGVYEAVAGSIDIIDGTIELSLVDQWAWLERTRFMAPTEVDIALATSRAELIQIVVEAAWSLPAVPPEVVVIDDGGTGSGVRVWDRERTQLINDMATDGGLDCYFNASGQFVIRSQPIIDQGNVVWTFRTGESSNILSAERERPFDRLYNTVVVNPIDEEQTWTSVTVSIEDPANPRYYEKIGFVPYFYSSPTIVEDFEAELAADTILQRVQGTTETVTIGALGNPALEVGDNVLIAHEETMSDPGFNAVHLIDGWDYDLATGAMSLKTRSSDLVLSEEA